MANISNLTSKILKDAEARKESILQAANAEKAEILEKKSKEAKVLEAEMTEKAEREAQTSKERVISGAELKSRNKKLAAKQVIINEVFEKSVDALCALSDNEYTDFIKNTIINLDIDGDESLILNEQGKKLLNDTVLKEINDGLVSKGKKGEIKITNEVGNFKGGFILEKGGIEINNTFEALVSSLKEELEFEVAKVLFN